MKEIKCTFPGCGRTLYLGEAALKSHLKSHNSEIKSRICFICKETFNFLNLKIHFKEKHGDENEYFCPEEGCNWKTTKLWSNEI